MQQIKNVWLGLDTRKRIIVAAATVAMFASILALSHLAGRPSMQLLYAGLESGSAGDVVRALDQRGTQYEVRGGSIYVPASARDELRMTLASEGLPANGGKGYELLDTLSGFGTTSQMFDAAYWRAKEGELARTIVASPYVGQARVHIANTGSNPFQRAAEPTASVSVVPMGAPVTPAQANAIRYLIASAVTGLTVENVAVIDANGTLIGSPEAAAAGAGTEDRSQAIRERVMRLVEARVGRGNAVVEVSVETVTDTETIRETRIDPESRVAISTDVEERADSSTNQSGDVTVASNIPDGDAAGGEGSKASTSSTRERVNYEISETNKEILRGPGAIKRLTVAVLVNGVPAAAGAEAAAFEPRSEAELEALRELISAAVGFDPARGDVITLKSMDLPAIAPEGTVATSSALGNVFLDAMTLIQIAALALVSLILGLFVVRPIMASRSAPAAPALQPPAPEPLAELPALGTADFMLNPDLGANLALDGEVENSETGEFEPLGGGLPALGGGTPDGLPGLGAVPEQQDPVERLRAMIGERQEETVQILRGWLEEKEEKA